ncbi:MAG: aldo/keto reductase [Pseudomonadota bacterium]
MIETRPIKSTSVSLSKVGFGGASIGNLYTAMSDAVAAATLAAAWDAGIRFFDTAPHYGRGRSEERLGAFLKDKPRETYRLSTKVGRVLRPGDKHDFLDQFADPLPNAVHYDYSAKGFEESLAGSRQRLRVDQFDIVFVHDIGTRVHGADNGPHLADLLATGLPYLAKLKADGVIGGYGIGVNETAVSLDILRQHPLDVILIAGRYTLLDRKAEAELAPLCIQKGTTLILGGVFNSGILATGPQADTHFDCRPVTPTILAEVEALQRACSEAGLPLPTAAIQFALSRPNVASVLLGMARPEEVVRNMASVRASVTPQLIERLEALGLKDVARVAPSTAR